MRFYVCRLERGRTAVSLYSLSTHAEALPLSFFLLATLARRHRRRSHTIEYIVPAHAVGDFPSHAPVVAVFVTCLSTCTRGVLARVRSRKLHGFPTLSPLSLHASKNQKAETRRRPVAAHRPHPRLPLESRLASSAAELGGGRSARRAYM